MKGRLALRPRTRATLPRIKEDIIFLSELLAGFGSSLSSSGGDIDVAGISIDSRKVVPGDLFVALDGRMSNGSKFIGDAFANGAVAAITSSTDVAAKGIISVPKLSREVLAKLVSRFYGDLNSKVALIGVTGTNGKTTVTHLIGHILSELGSPCGVIGTLNGNLTTPEAPELFRRLDQLTKEAKTSCAMEVSSIALEEGRLADLLFDIAIFTNLTPDHLDYHGNIENYFRAKENLFKSGRSRFGVVNRDSSFGRRLIISAEIPMISFSIMDVNFLTFTSSGTYFELNGVRFFASLFGEHNLSNLLAAIFAVRQLGYRLQDISKAIRSFKGVDGRLQLVGVCDNVRVYVDYAHSPDALEQVLKALRATLSDGGRVITVFGAGGNRDITKRHLMGEVVAKLADFAIVTNDNPRSEDPKEIVTAIVSGFSSDLEFEIELDRRSAIERAISLANPHDIVLIAGKGHERYQVIMDQTMPFSDFEVAMEALGK